MKKLKRNLLLQILRSILISIFDLPGTPFLNLPINLVLNLTKIRVRFSDLRDHRFNHNFNCKRSCCRCGLDDESSAHFLLCCPMFADERASLLSKISDIIHADVSVLPCNHLVHILLYGSNVCNSITNKLILRETTIFVRNTGRFTSLEAFRQMHTLIKCMPLLCHQNCLVLLCNFLYRLFVFFVCI